MEEFAFITISNGQCVVQHVQQRHVFRFRPDRVAGWDVLTLGRVEAGTESEDDPREHHRTALAFANRQVRRWLIETPET